MKQLVFVVQLHDATRMHYDFRLQIGSVMPSWSIPKGPTLDNTKKRLAMETTDHALEYRNFEGVIPEGSYGAGAVMVWDQGDYVAEVEIVDEGDKSKKVRKQITDFEKGQKVMHEGIKKGEIKFFLKGQKLKGSFALVKTHGFGPKNSWLLIKHQDEFVKEEYDAHEHDTSVKSGKTLTQIKESHSSS